MKIELVTVTPATAKEWLKKNCANNRSLRYADVTKFANDIKNGNWKITHQGLAFDKEGRLIDGQHRLSAIALAGVPVRMYVATGIEPDTMKVIDSGTSRTMSDRMKIAGHDEVYRSTRSASFVRCVNYVKFGETERRKYSTCEMEDYISRYYEACAFAKSMKNLNCGKAPIVVALVSAMQTEWKSSVNAFIACVNHNQIGEGNYNWKAALDFSNTVQNSKGNSGRVGIASVLEEEAEKAIYCFIHNKKRVSKSNIYPLSKEQLENFTFTLSKEESNGKT